MTLLVAVSRLALMRMASRSRDERAGGGGGGVGYSSCEHASASHGEVMGSQLIYCCGNEIQPYLGKTNRLLAQRPPFRLQ